MNRKNIEIESALKSIELLRQYKVAETENEKNSLVGKMMDVDGFVMGWLLRYKITPDKMIEKLEKAISLDKYRPKNLPITRFAMDKDLDYVKGDFCTFDNTLSKYDKNNVDPKKIREHFGRKIINVDVLAKQFTKDWLHRLKNHKDLIDNIRYADEASLIDAYNKLFKALAQDFYDEYGVITEPILVKDWDSSDIKNDKILKDSDGFGVTRYAIKIDDRLPESEQKKIEKEFDKAPQNHPDSFKLYQIRLNFTNIRKTHKNSYKIFCLAMCSFVHEMHHALDRMNARQGALGPQIATIDFKIYTDYSIDEKAYCQSATEKSSYKIGSALYNRLMKRCAR